MADDDRPNRLARWSAALKDARPLEVAAVALWLAAAITLLCRLPYGVSHRDEAFYSAMPYSFLLGNRPYFDELALHQNAGLLLVPFFRAYVAFEGSADGIIMFNRHLYFVYSAVCSAMAYRFARSLCGHVTACTAAALTLLFSYFSLLALSYNTCGAFGFFCGILCTAGAVRTPRPGWRLFGAGLFFLSAVFSYPGLAPALLLYLLVVVGWLYRQGQADSRRNALWGLGAAGVVFLVVGVPLLLWLGKPGLARLLAFSRSMGYASSVFEKLNFFVHSGIWLWRWQLLGFASVYLLLPLSLRFLRREVWVVAVLGAAALGYCYLKSVDLAPSGAAVCLTALPVLAPVCVALNRAWRPGRLLLALVWLPSVASMLCIAYSSANGYLAVSLGSLGVMLAGLLCLHGYLQGLSAREPSQQRGFGLVFAAVVAALALVEAHSLYASCYDVEPVLARHDTRVRSGPLRGAMATHSEAVFVETIDRDLKSVANGAKSITIFDGFATGYLSTRLQPRTFTQWIVWAIDGGYARAITKQTFGSPEKLPDVLLTVNVSVSARQYWEPYFKDAYVPVIRRDALGYVIWRHVAAPKRARHTRR